MILTAHRWFDIVVASAWIEGHLCYPKERMEDSNQVIHYVIRPHPSRVNRTSSSYASAPALINSTCWWRSSSLATLDSSHWFRPEELDNNHSTTSLQFNCSSGPPYVIPFPRLIRKALKGVSGFPGEYVGNLFRSGDFKCYRCGPSALLGPVGGY